MLYSILRGALAVLLLGSIVFSAFAPPPRGRTRRIRPSWLMILALALYLAGVLAAFDGFFELAGLACVCGISAFAVATWLTRPADPGEPPPDPPDDGGPPSDPQPPCGPDDALRFDWEAFERDLRTHLEERSTRV